MGRLRKVPGLPHQDYTVCTPHGAIRACAAACNIGLDRPADNSNAFTGMTFRWTRSIDVAVRLPEHSSQLKETGSTVTKDELRGT